MNIRSARAVVAATERDPGRDRTRDPPGPRLARSCRSAATCGGIEVGGGAGPVVRSHRETGELLPGDELVFEAAASFDASSRTLVRRLRRRDVVAHRQHPGPVRPARCGRRSSGPASRRAPRRGRNTRWRWAGRSPGGRACRARHRRSRTARGSARSRASSSTIRSAALASPSRPRNCSSSLRREARRPSEEWSCVARSSASDWSMMPSTESRRAEQAEGECVRLEAVAGEPALAELRRHRRAAAGERRARPVSLRIER